MAWNISRSASIRLLTVLVLIALPFAASGCSQSGGTGASSGQSSAPPANKPAATGKPAEPKYSSWVVYINDDDSYSQGSVTYKIALNLTATNPTGDEAGKYTGNATASTTTQGTVGGAQLNAQAIANSGTLQFKLEDTTAGGALAGLSTETANADLLSGRGAITMKAAGHASVGPAGGSYSNTSGQQIDVQVKGSKVTLQVGISGHTYTFHGTISGK
ncbi:MAG TPA: hypothetical protein VGK50_05570 [Coriobacteriia bacterium]|jgi:hypothetical protein